MRLSRRFDQALVLVVLATVALLFGCLFKTNSLPTFAEGEEGASIISEEKFVTFFDDGEKLTVRTDAKTVKEA